MGHISQLPNEILLGIFEHVHTYGTYHLCAALLCCRAWYGPAVSVLYNHVQLNSKLSKDSSAALFMRKLRPNKAFLVQSLTLSLSRGHLAGLRNDTPRSYERVLELLEGMPLLDRLTSFSLLLQERGRGAPYPIPTHTIAKLLERLPSSVRRLNLECDAPDTSSPSADSCMCKILSPLLLQLQDLRLRLPHCCESLFADIIRTRHTYSPLEFAVVRSDTTPTSMSLDQPSELQATIIGNAVNVLKEAGRFPYLRRFVIIDRSDSGPSLRNDRWSVFRVRDLNDNQTTTTVFPWCARGGSSSLYMIRDLEGDWFGSFHNVSSCLEGSLSWIPKNPTSSTRRLHTSRVSSNQGAWALDRSELVQKESVTQKFGVAFRLWKHEELTGTSLLRAHATMGFDETTSLTEDVPNGWGWTRGGPWGWTLARTE